MGRQPTHKPSSSALQRCGGLAPPRVQLLEDEALNAFNEKPNNTIDRLLADHAI